MDPILLLDGSGLVAFRFLSLSRQRTDGLPNRMIVKVDLHVVHQPFQPTYMLNLSVPSVTKAHNRLLHLTTFAVCRNHTPSFLLCRLSPILPRPAHSGSMLHS